MANEVKWKSANARTSGISGDTLNSGANVLGSSVDNSTNLDRYLDLDLSFTCGTAPTANDVIEIYALYAIDGTNFEDGDATPTDPTKHAVAHVAARAVTSEQRQAVLNIPIAPYHFRLLLKSELDQNCTATVDARTHNEDIQ